VVEDTAANVRPIIRETSRLPQSLLDRGWGKAKEMARAQRAELAARPLLPISAFRAKFGLRVI